MRPSSEHKWLISNDVLQKTSLPKVVIFGPYFDGNSDQNPSRSNLKKPTIPPRNSSLRAFRRTQSRSSENLNPLGPIEEGPSTRRASSVSLPPRKSRFKPPPAPSSNVETTIENGPVKPVLVYTVPTNLHIPKLITPLSTPYVAAQTAVQPAIATPVLIIPDNENPFNMVPFTDDNVPRRVSTGSIDPFSEELEDDYEASILARGPAANLLSSAGADTQSSEDPHVGWKSNLLTVNSGGRDRKLPPGYSRRRSSSLPDLPGITGGRPLRSVKGRRATPWVHNVGINGTQVGNGRMGKMAFPALKRLSDTSVKSMESGHEVWFDAVEEQKEV